MSALARFAQWWSDAPRPARTAIAILGLLLFLALGSVTVGLLQGGEPGDVAQPDGGDGISEPSGEEDEIVTEDEPDSFLDDEDFVPPESDLEPEDFVGDDGVVADDRDPVTLSEDELGDLEDFDPFDYMEGYELAAAEYALALHDWTWEVPHAEHVESRLRPLATDRLWEQITASRQAWDALDGAREGVRESSESSLQHLTVEEYITSGDAGIPIRVTVRAVRSNDIMQRVDSFTYRIVMRRIEGVWYVDEVQEF